MCAQQNLRSAWASAQSDQILHCALNRYLRAQCYFMRRLWSDWVFAGHCVGFIMRRLKYLCCRHQRDQEEYSLSIYGFLLLRLVFLILCIQNSAHPKYILLLLNDNINKYWLLRLWIWCDIDQRIPVLIETIAEVNIGIHWSVSHHTQCLNSQQLFYVSKPIR